MDNLLDLFCIVDDFCQAILPELHKNTLPAKAGYHRPCRLTESEIMTIIIHFHQSRYRDFKAYYTQYVQRYLTSAFPKLVSYSRFVELMPSVLVLLCLFMHCASKAHSGIYFVDSTTLSVCHVKRAQSNRVFKGLAKKSKSTMGWYFGFKLHILINDKGDLLAFKLTKATTDDRVPVDELTQGVTGSLFGDKGYISQALFDTLYQRGLKLVTTIRRNMKPQLLSIIDKILLRKRGIVESVIDQLKNISQIEHSRHRSPVNFLVNLVAGLVAYTLQPKKPSLKLNHLLLEQM